MAERLATGTSLSARLAVGLGLLLLAGGLVLSVAALAYGRAAATDAFDRLLVGAANDIAASIRVEDGAPIVDLPVSAFELLALAPDDRIAYQVRAPDGRLLTGQPDLPQAPASAAEMVLFDAALTGEPARFIRVTRRFAERSLSGRVEVVVGQTTRARSELALSITRDALLGLMAGGIAMILLSVLVVRHALRPLDRLAGTLAARDPQDLTPLDGRVPREVAGMVAGMNRFMGRLDRQFDVMRSLISDTAHQLRTPVAALRAQADLAAEEADPERRAQLVARIHRRSVGLGRLLDQMLSRAMVIHRTDSARRETLDLRDVALDIVEAGDHALVAPGAEVRLDIGPDPVPVLADTLSLTEAARNLLSNALAHGRAPVTVGAGHEGGAVVLWVADSGTGPGAEVRAQLGQRFLHGAAARGESAGLGLSIAAAVAQAYGGRIEMSDRPGGFRVAMVFDTEART